MTYKQKYGWAERWQTPLAGLRSISLSGVDLLAAVVLGQEQGLGLHVDRDRGCAGPGQQMITGL